MTKGQENKKILKMVILVIIIGFSLLLILLLLPRHVHTESFNVIFFNDCNIHYFDLSDDEENLPPYEIMMKVVNARNGTPVEEAKVVIYGYGLNFSNVTNKDGITRILLQGYSIPRDVSFITLGIEVTKEGYRKLQWPDDIELHR